MNIIITENRSFLDVEINDPDKTEEVETSFSVTINIKTENISSLSRLASSIPYSIVC